MRQPAYVDLVEVKRSIEETFIPTHPARILFASFPDSMPVAEFELLAATMVKTIRLRPEG